VSVQNLEPLKCVVVCCSVLLIIIVFCVVLFFVAIVCQLCLPKALNPKCVIVSCSVLFNKMKCVEVSCSALFNMSGEVRCRALFFPFQAFTHLKYSS
jgi:hypothetical protein